MLLELHYLSTEFPDRTAQLHTKLQYVAYGIHWTGSNVVHLRKKRYRTTESVAGGHQASAGVQFHTYYQYAGLHLLSAAPWHHYHTYTILYQDTKVYY